MIRRRTWGSSPGRSFAARCGIAAWALALTWAPALRADNGDVLSVLDVAAEVGSLGLGLVDLTSDSTDGTFWTLGVSGASADNHRLYHLGRNLGSVLGSIENPHPMGSIASNDLTLNRGIAEGLSGSLWVLASVGPRGSQSYELRAVDRAGSPVPDSTITVVPEDDDANLYGLTWDALTRTFWTRDVQNRRLLSVALDGSTATSVALDAPGTESRSVHGRGLSFDNSDSTLYVPTGTVLDSGARKIVQVLPDGVEIDGVLVAPRTGIEVPLDQLPTNEVRGVQVYAIGKLRRCAVLGAAATVYSVVHEIPAVIPPSRLSCRLTRANQVRLDWVNHGSGESNGYGGSIQILRNGVPFTTVPGDTHTFTDATPNDGLTSYSVRASDSPEGAFGPASCACSVLVGPGGVIDWAELPGRCFDATVLPGGDVLVTDDGAGVVRRLGPSLDPAEASDLPSPWAAPGGIAFVPSIQIGFPPQTLEDRVAISNSADNRLRLVSLADPENGTTLSLRFPADVETPRVAGLTYLASGVAAEQRFVAVERNSGDIFTFNSSGALVSRCSPSETNLLIDSALSGGIDYDPLQDTYLAVFEDGLVRELFTGGGCPTPPGQFELSLESLGAGYDTPGFVGGIAIDANTLIVCNRDSGTLFRHLIFPFSPDFIRGDFDRDGEVLLTDAVATAGYLFLDGPPPACQDAADANDDGVLDIVDPAYLLFWLFVADSSPPPAPFPTPGNDPTFRDNLGCAE